LSAHHLKNIIKTKEQRQRLGIQLLIDVKEQTEAWFRELFWRRRAQKLKARWLKRWLARKMKKKKVIKHHMAVQMATHCSVIKKMTNTLPLQPLVAQLASHLTEFKEAPYAAKMHHRSRYIQTFRLLLQAAPHLPPLSEVKSKNNAKEAYYDDELLCQVTRYLAICLDEINESSNPLAYVSLREVIQRNIRRLQDTKTILASDIIQAHAVLKHLKQQHPEKSALDELIADMDDLYESVTTRDQKSYSVH
jgi:hypothetical protein